MKKLLLTLSVFLSTVAMLVTSCNPGVNTVQSYIEENINRMGNFDVTIMNVRKIDGEKFQNTRTGQDMYAFEFAATVQANQKGYVFVQEDGMVRNLTFFNYEPKDALNAPGLRIKEIRHVHQGDSFEIHNKVILEKKDSGWMPIALRWDLY